jgi:hypothetical protein
MYRQRRNNSLPGLVILVGAALLALAPRFSWAPVSIPPLGIDDRPLKLDAVPGLDFGGGDSANLPAWTLATAAVIGVLGLLLAATRIPGLGPVWRVAVLLILTVPGSTAFYLWSLHKDPLTGFSKASPGFWGQLKAGGTIGYDELGSIVVGSGPALYLLAAGTLCAFIGCCIPAGRETDYSDRRQVPTPPVIQF